MRLARIGAAGAEIPAVSDREEWFDLRPITTDVGPAFLAGGLGRAAAALAAGELSAIGSIDRFGPPLVGIGKIVCIGLNYRDHAEETGARPPDEPILFMKAPDTVVGPTDDVLIPRHSVKTDYEVELAVVIGGWPATSARRPTRADVIAGYAISNDVSEREFQLERGGQWDKGKNCETFNPFGPWIATTDEMPDPQAPGTAAVGERRAPPEGEHEEHDLRHRSPGVVSEPVHDPPPGGCDQHRHAGRSGDGASGRRVPPGR